MKINNVILIIVFSWWSNSAFAQPLSTLIQQGLNQNLTLKTLNTAYQVALEIAPQVSERPDPKVGIGVFPFPVETRVGAQVARAKVMQKIPWFGLLDSKAALANSKARALYERINVESLQIEYKIKKAYFQLYEIEQSQVIIQRNMDLLTTLERLALAKLESGKTGAADVLRVQLKIIELEQKIKILENKKKHPIIKINELTQQALDTPIRIEQKLNFANLDYNLNTLKEDISSSHPMFKMFALQQEISRKELVVNDLSIKPSFEVGAEYSLVNDRVDATPEHNGRDILQLTATLNIPLNRQKYAAKAREEQLRIAVVENKKEELLSRFMAEIAEEVARYETATLQVDLYQQQIEIVQAAINILAGTYSVEGSGFDELLRLEQDIIDYDLKIMKAIVESHLAKATIEQFIPKM